MPDSKRGRPRLASLPYVPIDPHIDTHPRTLAFVDALADHTEAPATLIPTIVVRLLCHAGAQAIDGNLGHMSDGVLRRRFAPEYNFPLGKLRETLVHPDHGFLVETDDGLLIHDWADGGGKLLAQRDAWREKKAAKSATSIFPEKSTRTLPNSRLKGKGKGKDRSIDLSARADGQPPQPAAAPVQSIDGLSQDSKNTDRTEPKTAVVARIAPDTGTAPTPTPKTRHTAAQRVTGASSTTVLGELAALPLRAPVAASQVEAALVAGGHMRLGSGTPGLGDLLRAKPLAWELLAALGRSHGKPPGYVYRCLVSLRESGEQPAPPPSPATAATGFVAPVQPARPPTVSEESERRRIEWERAETDTGMPPASPERRDKLIESGYPSPEDVEQMRASDGSWDRYDEIGEQTRAAARQAILDGLQGATG